MRSQKNVSHIKVLFPAMKSLKFGSVDSSSGSASGMSEGCFRVGLDFIRLGNSLGKANVYYSMYLMLLSVYEILLLSKHIVN